MGRNLIARRLAGSGIAAASVLALVSAQSAGAQEVCSTALAVKVFASHYVVASRSFTDLNRLESELGPLAGPASVCLDACGERAASALLAAAHRLRHAPQRIRMLSGTERECSASRPVAVQASVPVDMPPHSSNSEEVARYWNSVMP